MLSSILLASVAIAATPRFLATVETDAPSELKVVALAFQHPRDPARNLTARIVPGIGANLYSLQIGGTELMPQPKTLGELSKGSTGTPILYPTPNRVRNARFDWAGKTFSFPANNGKNFIHGLVRARPWSFGAPTASGTAASVTTFIDWDAQQPDFQSFPIKHRLSVTFTLGQQGLRIAYRVENQDSAQLPFGFALHPFFRIPGARKDVFVRIPAAHRMDAPERLPTGKLISIAGSDFDLRKPVSLEALNLDDVYFGLAPAVPPSFEWRDEGIRVTLGASKEFGHLVIYTPPGQPFFCLENQTSSTDGHNLFAQGFKKEAHLLIAAPGKTATGFVNWKISRMAN